MVRQKSGAVLDKNPLLHSVCRLSPFLHGTTTTLNSFGSINGYTITTQLERRTIYVSLAITTLQVLLMLTIFECCRRSTVAGHVYDRRRHQRPTRTPPPLMQQRLWCCEWWRIRLSDPTYQQQAQQEAKERRQQRNQQDTNSHKKARRWRRNEKPNSSDPDRVRPVSSSLTKEENWHILQQAEQICFQESPFFDPTQGDEEDDDDKEISLEDIVDQDEDPTTVGRKETNKNDDPGKDDHSDDTQQLVKTEDTTAAMTNSSTSSVTKLPLIDPSFGSEPIIEPPPVHQPAQRRRRSSSNRADPIRDFVSELLGTPTTPNSSKNDKSPEEGQLHQSGETSTMDQVEDVSSEVAYRDDSKFHAKKGARKVQTLSPLANEPPQPLSASERRRRKFEHVPTVSDEAHVMRKTAAAVAAAGTETSMTKSNKNYATNMKEVKPTDEDQNMLPKTGEENGSGTGAESGDHTDETKQPTTSPIMDSVSSPPQSPTSSRPRVRFRQTNVFFSDASSSLETTKQAGNKNQSPKFPKPLRLSQRDVSDSTRTADVTMGTEESARLARLRYDQGAENKVTWDIDCLTCIAAFIRRRVLVLHNNHDNGANTDGNEDEDDAGRNGRRVRRENSMSRVQQDFLAQKVHRRPLSMEQQEMLRCIGLDAFMTLRFLEFGFDVSFWPFLFSLITLVPTFVTGDNDQVGYYRSTALNLPLESERHWAVVVFGIFHFIYILRRIWIEWEIFLPLRYDFLENGDFDKSKHQDQYRHTCLVEYVPRSHKHDQDVFKFFDAIFPGQVKRAEFLLNTYEMICVGFMFV